MAPDATILQNIIRTTNACPIILNNSYPITESDNPLQPITRPMSDEETPSWDLTTYKNRLKTFDGVWKLQFITSDQMAKAGLYYLGIQDRVRCLFCSTEFDYWQHGDDPVVEHKRQSPQCPFFNDSSAGYDVCGLYSSVPDDFKSNHESKNVQDFLCSVGILQQITPLKHKDFATLEARLQSFEKCLMPLKQDIQTLCEAGLFYIGNGTNDHMICYYCNQGLKDWEDNDEPWTEHARWSETCSYVLLNKGKNFVDKACGVTSTKFNLTEFFKLTADTSITLKSMKIGLMKRKLDQPDISQINISTVATEEHLCKKREPNTELLCKICFINEMQIAFLPCNHVIACIECALTIKICCVCRQPINWVFRVFFSMNEQQQLPVHYLERQVYPIIRCQVCHVKDITAAFLPCRHIYACVKCAADKHECPVCTESVCATIQVYL